MKKLQFNIDLTNSEEPTEQITLVFDLFDSSIVHRFCNLIKMANTTSCEIQSSWGIGREQKDPNSLIEALNTNINCFNDLNKSGYLMGFKVANSNLSASLLNAIHDRFECYMNAVVNGNKELIKTDNMRCLLEALNSINNHVHLLESWIAQQHSKNEVKGYFTARYRNMETKAYFDEPLSEDDYNSFTMEESFGGLYVNYATVGKSLQQIYWSDDLELLKSGGASPQQVLTAGIIAKFNSEKKSHKQELDQLSKWCIDQEVQKYGINYQDKMNGNGSIKLGQIAPVGIAQNFYDGNTSTFDAKLFGDYLSCYSKVNKMWISEKA